MLVEIAGAGGGVEDGTGFVVGEVVEGLFVVGFGEELAGGGVSGEVWCEACARGCGAGADLRCDGGFGGWFQGSLRQSVLKVTTAYAIKIVESRPDWAFPLCPAGMFCCPTPKTYCFCRLPGIGYFIAGAIPQGTGG